MLEYTFVDVAGDFTTSCSSVLMVCEHFTVCFCEFCHVKNYYIVLLFSVVIVSEKFDISLIHAPRSSHQEAVHPSVKRVICGKMKETFFLIPHERSFILVF